MATNTKKAMINKLNSTELKPSEINIIGGGNWVTGILN